MFSTLAIIINDYPYPLSFFPFPLFPSKKNCKLVLTTIVLLLQVQLIFLFLDNEAVSTLRSDGAFFFDTS